MDVYTCLDGSRIELHHLDDVERRFLVECLEMYRSGVSWPDFVTATLRSGTPLLRESQWVTKEVMQRPLYKLVRDLQDRLGIQQGWMAPDPGDRPDQEPMGLLPGAYVPVAQAAAEKGVHRTALIKAIKTGRLVGVKGESGWLVSRQSLEDYEPMVVRQAAARKARGVDPAEGVEQPAHR